MDIVIQIIIPVLPITYRFFFEVHVLWAGG